MKTVYIHIGQPKTGTTAIQDFCNDSSNWLLHHNLYYAGGLPVRYCIEDIILRLNNEKYLTDEVKKDILLLWGRLNGRLKKNAGKNILISYEHIYLHTYINIEKALKFLINESLPNHDIKIICYLKNSQDLLLGVKSESIKNYNSRDKEHNINDLVYFTMCDPSNVLKAFKECFGDNSLILRNFDNIKNNNLHLINDFMSILNITIPSYININYYKNKKYSKSALDFKNKLNDVFKYLMGSEKDIIDYLNSSFEKNYNFTRILNTSNDSSNITLSEKSISVLQDNQDILEREFNIKLNELTTTGLNNESNEESSLDSLLDHKNDIVTLLLMILTENLLLRRDVNKILKKLNDKNSQ